MKVKEDDKFFAELVLELSERLVCTMEDLISKENMKNIKYQAVIPAAVQFALMDIDRRNNTKTAMTYDVMSSYMNNPKK